MSDFNISCTHCNQKLEVPEDMRGLIVECPSCGKELKLHAPAHPIKKKRTIRVVNPNAISSEYAELKSQREARIISDLTVARERRYIVKAVALLILAFSIYMANLFCPFTREMSVVGVYLNEMRLFCNNTEIQLDNACQYVASHDCGRRSKGTVSISNAQLKNLKLQYHTMDGWTTYAGRSSIMKKSGLFTHDELCFFLDDGFVRLYIDNCTSESHILYLGETSLSLKPKAHFNLKIVGPANNTVEVRLDNRFCGHISPSNTDRTFLIDCSGVGTYSIDTVEYNLIRQIKLTSGSKQKLFRNAYMHELEAPVDFFFERAPDTVIGYVNAYRTVLLRIHPSMK